MDNSKLFENSQKEIESAFQEFDVFYEKMQGFLRDKEITSDETTIIKEIQDIVDTLDKGPKNMKTGKHDLGYAAWDGDSLTRADGRLSTLMFNLGTIASDKVQRANVYGRWTKWRKFNEWNPAKQNLETELLKLGKNPRVFKEDIEGEVGKKMFAENVIETMMAGHADLLTTMFDATRSVLTALAHRINFELRQK